MSTFRFFECNAPEVIFEQFEDETVVINLGSGHYYTLDAVGAAVWHGLTAGTPVDDVVDQLRRDTAGDPQAIDAAVREFVHLLLSEQLVRPVVAPNGARPEAPSPRLATFHAPRLEKYDDMAEMLLLDPVHDVDAAGWPSAPAAPAPDGGPRATGSRGEGTTLVETDDAPEWPARKRGG